jgi:hypothetical protein
VVSGDLSSRLPRTKHPERIPVAVLERNIRWVLEREPFKAMGWHMMSR